MAAPTNIDTASAIELGPLPNTLVQDVNDSGTTYQVYYKYTAQPGDNVIGIWAFGDLAVYKPSNQVIPEISDNIVQIATNKRVQFPVNVGEVYYFRIFSSTGDVSPASLTISGLNFSDQDAPAGSIAVNDDAEGFPLALLDRATAAPLRYVQAFPAGEQGDTVPDATVCVEDISTWPDNLLTVKIFSGDYALVATHSYATTNPNTVYIRSNKVDAFYLGTNLDDRVSGATSVQTLSTSGTASTPEAIGSTAMLGLAPSNDETILYFSADGGSGAVKRWEIGVGAMSDLVAGLAGWDPLDILVLADDSIVVMYHKVTGESKALRYDPAGALLNTYTFTDSATPRLAYDNADATTFWAWIKPYTAFPTRNGESHFLHILASDGTIIDEPIGHIYERGVYDGAVTATPSDDFGHSQSCPFWLTRESIEPPAVVLPVITSIINTNTGSSVNPMYCARPIVQRVTLVGTGFQDGLTVTGTDPLNQALVITIESVSETAIELSFSTDQYGRFSFYVTNPDAFVSAPFFVDSFSCSEPVTMRRLRRAAHLSDENQWTFYQSFTLDYEAGVGLNSGQGADPEVLLRWSDDGGHQWSEYHPMKIGKMGKYTHRAIWRRLGRSRKRLFEVVCTDPIKLVLLDAFLDLEGGTS